MKNIMIVSALILAIAGMSTAQADPEWRGQNNTNNSSDYRGDNRGNDHGNRHDNGNRDDNNRGNRHDNNRYDHGKRYDNNRGNHYGWDGQRYHAPYQYVRPNGYQVRTWRGGDRLPRAYRTSQYHVDYRQYHLNAPPRGYQYVRVNNDVVLTAIATGIIASVITGMYY